MVSTLSTYTSIVSNLSKWQTMTATDPTVQTATNYFKANIGKVTTIDQFVNNYQLFNYAMTAFGLSDMTYAKGLITKVLQQGVTSTSALANTLNNPAIKAFATTFDFATNGTSTTSSSTLQTTVVNKYIEQSLETSQGKSNSAVQLALYFQQNAPNVKDMYGILGDKNLLTVVQTALGISSSTSAQDITTQYANLTAKLNVADFQDPKKLGTFIARFCAMADSSGSGAQAASLPSSMISPISTSPTSDQPLFSNDLLMSIQSFKPGGY